MERQGLIPANIIEDIRNKADIVKVVSEYVGLKKRGKNYLGLCPFHSEKDASFTVSPEKQIFHCFGCNEGGNAFAFLMKMENISFVQAVEELGSKVGVKVPKSPQAAAARSKKEKLFHIMGLAAKYFQSQLSQPALDYLTKRKISEKTIKEFKLGYVPAGWDNLFKSLIGRGVNPEDMASLGLVLAREKKGDYYDRFRNRLIFCIQDPRGRVLAFGGRALGNEEPKYLNSPDTYIYHKGETLFGLNLSKDSIKKKKTAILVEGYFDLITPFQAGITNIVASLGTALTTNQAKLLSHYCETVIIAFDQDIAGGIAAERSIEIFRNEGLKVKVAKLQGGKDPDEIINKQGKEAFEAILEQALSYLDFKIKQICLKQNLNEIEGRSHALKEIATLLSKEKEEFVQNEYSKLAAQTLKTDAHTVFAEVKRLVQYNPRTSRKLSRVTEKPPSRLEEAEKCLISLAAQDQEMLELIKQSLIADSFTLKPIQKIAALLFETDFSKKDNPHHFLLENLPDEENKKYFSALMIKEHLPHKDKKEEVIKDCLEVIKNEQGKRKIVQLKTDLKTAETNGDSQKAAEILSLLKSEIS